MEVTLLQRIRHFFVSPSCARIPAFQRHYPLVKNSNQEQVSCCFHLARGQLQWNGLFILKKNIQNWPSTYAGVIQDVQWQRHRPHEFIHVPSIYTSSFHFLCSTFQGVRKLTQSADRCHCSTFILTIYSFKKCHPRCVCRTEIN
jgi:hypothetical protein